MGLYILLFIYLLIVRNTVNKLKFAKKILLILFADIVIE